MEEFTNKNNVANNTDDIILPTQKRITLQPLHKDISSDDESDLQIAASHANSTPIGNITSDRESTGDEQAAVNANPQNKATSTPPIAAKPKHHRVSYRSIIAMTLVIVALLIVLLSR